MFIHLKEISTAWKGQTFTNQYQYEINFKLEVIDSRVQVEKMISIIRVRLPKILEGLMDKESILEKSEQDDECAEFILTQYSKIMEFVEKGKFKVAVAYFELADKIYLEYQSNARWNEINDVRNMTWDALAKRGLI